MPDKVDVSVLACEAKNDPTLMLPLWEAIHRLIQTWAYRYIQRAREQSTHLYDADDLIQAGYLALVDAVSGYDPDSEKSFIGWLHFFIRSRFAEIAGCRSKKLRPEFFATSLDKPITDDTDRTHADLLADPTAEFDFEEVERSCDQRHLRACLDDCLSTIPIDHAAILRARYYENKTLGDIADERGCSRENIRCLENAGLRDLRHPSYLRQLQLFLDSYANAADAHKSISIHAFRDHQASSVERAVERRENMRKGLAAMMAKWDAITSDKEAI